MFCTQIGMVGEAGLQFVDGFGGNAGGQDLVQPLEGVMEPLQPADALFDAEARFCRLFDGAKPASCGKPCNDL